MYYTTQRVAKFRVSITSIRIFFTARHYDNHATSSLSPRGWRPWCKRHRSQNTLPVYNTTHDVKYERIKETDKHAKQDRVTQM